MKCPRCNYTLDDDTVFCGNCGAQVAPLNSPGATVAASLEDEDTIQARSNVIGNRQAAPPPLMQRFSPPAAPDAPAPVAPTLKDTPPVPRRGGSPLASARVRVIIALALIVLVGGSLGLFAVLKNGGSGSNATLGLHASGQITFLDNPNGVPDHTDAVTMSIQNLESPPSGFQYDAWLVNDATEQNIALGTLTASGHTFSLNYAGDSKNGQAGTNLLGAGNKVIITLEQGSVSAPTGQVILSATFPPKAFIHIRHLLFSFPITPNKIGLLVGLLGQVQLLSVQSLSLQNASANHNTTAIQCASQSLIDIIEGAQGSAYQPLSPTCLSLGISAAGDGFGILGNTGYDLLASEHASLAATQSDSTANIRLHASHVETAMTNIKNWATKIEQDALTLRASPNNSALIQEITTLSDHIFHGVDTNGDGRVDPVLGEAGAITAYNEGQLMATLQVVAGV
jgi:hypothetical protein